MVKTIFSRVVWLGLKRLRAVSRKAAEQGSHGGLLHNRKLGSPLPVTGSGDPGCDAVVDPFCRSAAYPVQGTVCAPARLPNVPYSLGPVASRQAP
jgi:hypothetical protein